MKKPPFDPLAAREYFAGLGAARSVPAIASAADVAPFDGAAFAQSVAAMLATITPATAEAVALDIERRRIAPRLAESGISAEHIPALAALAALRSPSSAGQIAAQFAALGRVRAALAAAPGAVVVLIGPRGTGKTQIAAQLFRDRIEAELRAENERREAWLRGEAFGGHFIYTMRYLKAASLFGRMKELFANVGTINAERREEELAILSRCDLVAIDELQEAAEAQDTRRIGFGKILTDLVDRRYAAKLPTILISNHYDPAKPGDLSLIGDFLGDSINSRVGQYGGVVVCDWQSFR